MYGVEGGAYLSVQGRACLYILYEQLSWCLGIKTTGITSCKILSVTVAMVSVTNAMGSMAAAMVK